jgi:hypothetical protein
MLPSPKGRLSIASFFLLVIVATHCPSQSRDVVCDEGYGSFQRHSKTGVTISIESPRSQGFSDHLCQATLSWNLRDSFTVATNEDQIDLDAAEIDLGLETPVVAFQTRRSSTDKSMDYEIYSLTKPPRQLRVITGGDWFSAADTDLDGHVEIWAGDAIAASGFDDIALSAFDFAPPIVLRFDGKQLIDVSAQFRSEYDQRIAALRSQLDSTHLEAFKLSDGKLKALLPPTPAEWARLRQTKVRILEIVWCYLYSGRAQEAWDTLAAMWPPSDLERVHTAIVDAKALGIGRQVDGISTAITPNWKKRHEMIFQSPVRVEQFPARDRRLLVSNSAAEVTRFSADSSPIEIQLTRPPFADGTNNKTPVPMELIIDSAGKVRSATVSGHPDPALQEATKGWKFIPAFKNGHPVACDLHMNVAPLQ